MKPSTIALAVGSIAVLPLPVLTATPVGAQSNLTNAITIEQPWSRQTASGQSVGGGFMTIANRGKSVDRLLGGITPAAARVEVHMMSMEGGIMRMRPVPGGLAIPAGGRVDLKPGGCHIMFIGLKAPLALGTEVPVTLRFQRAGNVMVRFRVLPIGATGPETSHDRH